MEAFENKCAHYICDANEVVHFKLGKLPDQHTHSVNFIYSLIKVF